MKNSYVNFTTAAALAAITIACGSQEGQVIDNFFRATKAKDNQTVISFSMVQFDQEVKTWKVKSVGEEQRAPAPLSKLAAAHQAADEAAAENKKDEGAYFNTHPLEVDKVKTLLEKGGPIPANLEKTATDWKRFIDADKDLKEKVDESQKAYDREKRLVTMSTGKAGDVDSLVGDVISNTAIVEVDSGSGVKSYSIQLRKYDVTAGGKGAKLMSRWLIQSITPQ